ncbi:uncharacterized protein LOC130282696 [Hyla sarda]|uniref:uncharacterized protein LOC130282696 n=1 Tax=Hyla sarda TaxID=327740 RepID=UPI0024C3CF95|nr:uncharacterized protein LOC130282696 [Hyla sarda]XP_056387188.1 uncharacterized protein LOC130282696 [Hyla sarda]XP_056387189.1 uncharacterized protein LOC130282696 [Hyla sarda]XP_056387190.1 uncharacterized protein LOC130282696 [Hyla sarda]XP_056387191.1 uncharacterized protein LOC130282696 [Hyla sarda]
MSSHLVNSVPTLKNGNKYHVFISYSSGDSVWVSGLISKLENTFPSLKICFHERDFVPGKTIIDNMVECIQRSQKTVMVLSPDFVRSRWCQFEAKLFIFQDCMLHKAIVPIMLRPCPVPLQLSHLTYLEADDKQFFDKLCHVLLCNNEDIEHSNKLVHYQPSLLYNGKHILTLPAVNEECEFWQNGIFSYTSVPDQLKVVLDDSEVYKQAIEHINDIPVTRSCLRFTTCKVLLCIFLVICIGLSSIFSAVTGAVTKDVPICLPIAMVGILLLTVFINILCWNSRKNKLIMQTMVLKTCETNLIFSEYCVLAGCSSRTQLVFVYVSLCHCKETIQNAFGHDSQIATEMWKKSIIYYSSDYACCLAKKHFPFASAPPPGHIEDGICFCQYISILLDKGCSVKYV